MYFGRGNLKLAQNVLVWNLPIVATCPGAGECKEWCYERKIERLRPNVRRSRERNLADSRRQDFVQAVVAHLLGRNESTVRIHESGDFYCKEYFDKWCEVARQLPWMTFLAYTKSYWLWDMYSDLPDNFKLIQSVESARPDRVDWSRSTARVIDNPSECRRGEFICPQQLGKKRGVHLKCGLDCRLCMLDNIHVCFLRH